MIPERLGPIGGLAADRPLVTTLVIAFGLTALAVLGTAEAPQAAESIANLILASALVAAAPLMLAAVAPRNLIARLAIAAFAGGVPIALATFGAPAILPAPFALWPAAAGCAIFAALLLAMAPLFGPAQRFAFIAVMAALLGMTGVLGLLALEGAAEGVDTVAFATLGFSAGAVVGIGAVFDFAALFSEGADRRKAAGGAARYATAPALFAALAAAGAAAIHAWPDMAQAARTAWLAGAATLISAVAALFMATAALALRKSSEQVASDENRRRERFRRAWRPLRRSLAPSSALAAVAIIAIAVVAAGFGMPDPPLAALAFCAGAGVVGGVLFYSIRSGAMIFMSLSASAFLAQWGIESWRGAALTPLELSTGLALAAVLSAQLAVCWRDARSPRLNARETTQFAMSEAFARHVMATLAGSAALFAASLAGPWQDGAAAAAYFAALCGVMLLLAPVLMTALTHVVRRDLN